MPRWQRTEGDSRVTSRPLKCTVPWSGCTLPVIRLNSVVLPAPFGPMMPRASPWPSAIDSPSVTRSAP